jgi:hypothetical protein
MWYSNIFDTELTVDFIQCTTHHNVQYTDGPRQIWRHLKEGREDNYRMLKGAYIQPDQMQWSLFESHDRSLCLFVLYNIV